MLGLGSDRIRVALFLCSATAHPLFVSAIPSPLGQRTAGRKLLQCILLGRISDADYIRIFFALYSLFFFLVLVYKFMWVGCLILTIADFGMTALFIAFGILRHLDALEKILRNPHFKLGSG